MNQLAELGRVKAHINGQVRLRPHEEVIKVSLTDDTASILLTTYEFTDTAREIRFTRKGTKLMSWKRHETGFFLFSGEMTMWDDQYVPETIVNYGRSNTPAEVIARMQYERDCYRPGSSTNPLDNYERVLAGATTDAMERYW